MGLCRNWECCDEFNRESEMCTVVGGGPNCPAWSDIEWERLKRKGLVKEDEK